MAPSSDTPLPQRIVDAHHHLWELSRFPYRWLAPDAPPRRFGDHSSIKRDYLPADYRADFKGLTLAGSVHVQANCGAADPVDETAWLQELAEREGCPTAIVAEADLTGADAGQQIRRHRAHANLRGIRALVAWDAGGRWRFADRPGVLSEPAFRAGAAAVAHAGLSLDLVVAPEQLPEVARLALALPGLPIAVNHLAQVEPAVPDSAETWRSGLEAIADCPSVAMKLSGLWTIDPTWSVARLRPFVDRAMEVLGPDRLMYGSNLPVEKVNTGAMRQVEALTGILHGRGRGVLDSVFFETANRFYRLGL